MMKAKTLVVLLGAVAVLAACGGGNGGDSSTGNNSGNSSSGGSSSSGGTGGSTTASSLKPTQYSLYKYGTQAPLSGGAGTVSSATANGGTLALDSGSTVLTITDATQGSMSATGFYITNRASGSVIMLCDSLSSGGTVGTGTKSRYVGAAISTNDGTNQATQVTNAADLAGQTLYNIEDCSYQSTAGNPQGQNSAPDPSTASLTVDSSGNVTFNNGTAPITAAQFSALLSGSAASTTNSNTYFTAYKVGSGSVAKSLIVERGIPTDTTKTGYVGMWVTN
ncbi:TPA: hypothetical protein U2Q23_003047 [Burkholderia multivorans]|uniref:hypothetical protein n=1 Tax=Burkholderia cepacia complex TaxID=87882 RepID=UPI0012FD07DB|nr:MULTISPECIES: hypothetical protein [Burkholderiaceae]MBR8477318.1 hypothetical protein [Burkholderia cenocepacia]HEM7839900.1 hypothetical protein [Burkholderia multivorans]HEM7868115.1 hypothetical protein [Burkholderia multivorans]HEM8536919.1 hypothetical protein [Burkholderia multivorans]